jgi:SAM-dependent methyltransferase
MTGVWLPRLVEPDRTQRVDGGILRLMPPTRLAAIAPFLDQYRLVREREGYRRATPEFYRALPDVADNDPQRDEWRVRRESFAHLLQHTSDVLAAGGRILDLGAGNGWLSHRFAALGHKTVAIDWLDDEEDGLGACRHYQVPFAAVQADFDALPFEPGQFDLAVLGGSLHYSASPAATLAEATRMLRPGGALVVMDSPMFAREEDGEAMVAGVRRQFTSVHGVANPVRPGVGFLTYDAVDRAFRSLGMMPRFFRSHGPLGWRLRRPIAHLRLGRAPAAFGVWIAR